MNWTRIKSCSNPRSQYWTFLGLTAIGFACLATAVASVQDRDRGANRSAIAQTADSFAEVTAKATPAVVFIQVEKQYVASDSTTPFGGGPEGFDDEWMKRFFGDRLPKSQVPRQPRQAMGQGSGFIMSEDGYILTNSHVVGGADKVKVTLADGREFDAEIIGTDSQTDVAIIKIDAVDLTVLPLGNSDDIQVGEWVLAIGSPFGLPGTVTSGIVSAKGRSSVGIADYEDFIQTDAAINPGNSGGPLVNLRGEAIGINTAIYSRGGGYMGIGFAVPVNMAKQICSQLIENGSVTRGYLGVVLQELTAEIAESFGLEEADGVLVSDVSQDSPAAKAGVQAGDIIVEVNGRAVNDMGRLRNRVAHIKPGSEMAVTVLRDGKPVELTVTTGRLSGKATFGGGSPARPTAMGMTVVDLTSELASEYGYAEQEAGVIVTNVQPGSPAAKAGIRPGALIKEVGRKPVQNMDEFTAAMKEAKEKDSVLLLVKLGDYSRYVVLKLQS